MKHDPLDYIKLAYPDLMTDEESFEYDEFCIAYWAEFGWSDEE